MECAVSQVKTEPGLASDGADSGETFSDTSINMERTLPQITNAEESCQFAEFYPPEFVNVGVKVENDLENMNLPIVKPEPGSPTESDGEGEGGEVLYSEIDISLPDVKQESSEYSRNADQHNGIFKLHDSALANTTLPNLATTSSGVESSKTIFNLTAVTKYSCTQCAFICNRKGTLNNHILTHSGKKPFSCSQCSFTSYQKCSLRTHMLIHSKKKVFSCPHCTYTCNYKARFSAHILIHSEKSLSCSQCSNVSYSESDLLRHTLLHSGKKSFSCPHCTYSCNRKDRLSAHMLIHSGEKPFLCPHCSYTCKRKGNLKVHLLTHPWVKLFSCPQCAYTCYQKSDVSKHMLTHVKENPMDFAEFEFKPFTKQNLKTYTKKPVRSS